MNMRKTILISIFILVGFILQAQPVGYYNAANNKTGAELLQALHDIIDGHTTITYDAIWSKFPSLDPRPDDNTLVWDIYSDIPGGTPKYFFTFGDDQCGSYQAEGGCYNREHSWPQSWFSSQSTPSTDLHHIFPTDGFVNSKRSNYPYGEVQTAEWTSLNGSKLGTCKSSLGYSGTVFEPIDAYKGDIARAYFYMSVRYYGEDDNWSTSGMTNKSEILPWAMTMLLRWNDEDPVSDKEINRNNAIYAIQNNRNPFIDNPNYAHMIWDSNWSGGNTSAAGDYAKITSTAELSNGEYLIVFEGGSKAFDGGLSTLDAANNNISVTINSNAIASNATTNAATFTITKSGNTYTIKSASGYYIGQTGNANGLASSTTTTYANSITFDSDGNANIVSGGTYLRFNNGTNDQRFRYYKSSSYTSQQAIQLYKKNETYTITLASVEHGSISVSAVEAIAGATITLNAAPDTDYELDSWSVIDAQNNPVAVTNNQFTMPASNVTVSATFVYVGQPFTQQYYLVTDVDQLVAGRTYLIVNIPAGKAMGSSSSNGNNRVAVSATITNNTIADLGSACELLLGSSGNYWTLFDASWGSSGGYLYAASSGSNYLKTEANLADNGIDNGKWSITFNTSTHAATIQAQGSNTRNIIRYNSGSTLFSCYNSTSGQQDVYLFARSETVNFTENSTVACLNTFDKNTIQSGVTVSATKVLGKEMCNNASQLVIEEGGQLIHHTAGIKATMKKNIAAYTTNGGWYTIATPFTDFDPSLIADGNYDLYAYDEDGELEWVNYKAHPTNFPVNVNNGYLYAHNPNVTILTNGTLNSGDYTEMVSLSYANDNANIIGFNLLGNPTAHSINFSKSSNVSDGYYYLSNSETWEYEPNNTVPAGRGFLVKANGTGQSVTLNSQSKRGDEVEDELIKIDIDGEYAYVKMTDGVSMPLLGFRDHYSSVYLTRDKQSYIMLVNEDANDVDLNYSARYNGQHNLNIDVKGDLPYLHLIDRLTGADIDLLQTPYYTFEGKHSDYSNRFKLMFRANDDSQDNDDFAFISNGELVVNGKGTLEVFDVLGRQLFAKQLSTLNSQFSILTSPGVYVLRLINDGNVRVQKIVIE